MKRQYLYFAALAAVCLAACNPEEQPGTTDPKEEPKSTECRLSSFVVNVGEGTIDAFIDQVEKTVELSYMPAEYEALASATAEVKISEKATISPDPSQPIDYTAGDVKFTVTAEDNTTFAVYTIKLAQAEFTERAEFKWSKTYGELGTTGANTGQACIAFCDVDKFAMNTLDVFDLEGNKLGQLNTEGIPGLDTYNGQLGSMSNDENGVLVALCCYGGANESATVHTSIYAWIDGWDKAPTLIYGPTDYQCFFMSVAGDVTGKFIVTLRTGVSAPPQMHHVLIYDGNGYSKDNITWKGPKINHPSNDGVWAQMIAFFTSDPEDGFLCYDSLGAAEYGDDAEGNTNASSAVYVYDGLTAYENQFNSGEIHETPLYGGVNWVTWDADGRRFGYGNYSTGHARAFVYNGQKYALVSSASWPNAWITIQKADNLVEDDDTTDDVDESEANYFLPTQKIEETAASFPSGAYVYDPASGTGHVLVAAQPLCVVAYDMITDRI